MPDVLIGMGSNLGDRSVALDRAVEMMKGTEGIAKVQVSAWHSSKPVGGPEEQAEFLNGVARLETTLEPETLFNRLQAIEADLGRVRQMRWGPRSLDLDLLLYDEQTIDTPRLRVPHPRMAYRRFVLEPAATIAGSMRHPEIGWTINELFQHLQSADWYVALTGPAPADSRRLADRVAAATGWQLLDFPGMNEVFSSQVSPSLSVSRSIEFLHDWADLLDATLGSEPLQGAISAVWAEDLLAIGDVQWPGALEGELRKRSAPLRQPKLLVYYEPSVSRVAGDRLAEQIDQARRNRARRQGRGPILWLEDVSEEEAFTEIVAAIQAMR